MKMHIGSSWVDKDERIDVLNPYDGSIVDTVPRAEASDIDRALATAVRGAEIMRKLTGYERYKILHKAADLIRERAESFAETITLEGGKVKAEAMIEVERAAEIIYLSAEEAKRLGSEVIPLDGAPGVTGKFGFTIRVPCGVVAAISPFNFPLHLVCHKVGPGIAAGNAVVLKPATDTPLSGLRVVEVMLEAGCPPEALQCLTGSGAEIGDALVSDPRVRKITFTGSRDVGEHICRTAGLKKVTMELGSNSPVIIMPDADMNKVTTALASTGYAHAGQVCISTQRVYANREIYSDFLDAFTESVKGITTGDPRQEGVRMGPMIRESDAVRVEEWVQEAVDGGARLVAGGQRNGTLMAPTLLADVKPEMRISCDEVFGPAVGVTPVDDIDEAIAQANSTNYGLSTAIFTENLDWAMKFALEAEAGNIHLNWGTQWRADLMPYGGLKDSGMGKEGPKYAVEEMTETKMVVLHMP